MRSLVAAILLLLLLPAAVVANGSWWANQTILDERSFTTVVGRALDSSVVRDRIAARVTAIVLDKLDAADGRTQQLLRTMFGVGEIPDRRELELALRPRFAATLEEPAVRTERDRIMASVHRFVVSGAGGSSEFVAIEGASVVLDLSPVIEMLAATIDPRLTAAGLTEFTAQDASIVLAEAGRLRTVGSTLQMLATASTGLPLGLGGAILVILALAHRRIRALGLVGMTLLVAGLVCLTLAVLAGEFARGISDSAALNAVAGWTYDAFATLLMEQSLVLAAGGTLVAVVAWVALRLRRSED